MMRRLGLAAAVAATLTGCTWVRLSEGGAAVRLATAADVVGCAKVGEAHATTQDRVVVARSAAKVAEELQVLAQNHAADLGGNTIVAKAPPADGGQSFDVYRCDPG